MIEGVCKELKVMIKRNAFVLQEQMGEVLLPDPHHT